MAQLDSILIPALAPSLYAIEPVPGAWGEVDSLRQLRFTLEDADKEAEDLLSDYKDVKERCDKAHLEVSICQDQLASCYATGDLAGASTLQEKQEAALLKQATARDDMMSILYALGEMARNHQEYRRAIADIDQAATAFTKAIKVCSALTKGDGSGGDVSDGVEADGNGFDGEGSETPGVRAVREGRL